jgi:hypothetical protein
MRKSIIAAAAAIALLPFAAKADYTILALRQAKYCTDGTTLTKALYFKASDGTTATWASVPIVDPSSSMYEYYKELRQQVYMIYSSNAGRFNNYSTAGSDACGAPILQDLWRGTP